jgi:hypothetical protein
MAYTHAGLLKTFLWSRNCVNNFLLVYVKYCFIYLDLLSSYLRSLGNHLFCVVIPSGNSLYDGAFKVHYYASNSST